QWTGVFSSGSNASGGLATTPTADSGFFGDGDGIPQPYLVAALVRITGDGTTLKQLVVDTIEGGPTIGKDNNTPGKWGVTTEFGDPWPATDQDIDTEQTVLMLCQVDGADSFLELVYRD